LGAATIAAPAAGLRRTGLRAARTLIFRAFIAIVRLEITRGATRRHPNGRNNLDAGLGRNRPSSLLFNERA
jgi:hypothetical protein